MCNSVCDVFCVCGQSITKNSRGARWRCRGVVAARAARTRTPHWFTVMAHMHVKQLYLHWHCAHSTAVHRELYSSRRRPKRHGKSSHHCGICTTLRPLQRTCHTRLTQPHCGIGAHRLPAKWTFGRCLSMSSCFGTWTTSHWSLRPQQAEHVRNYRLSGHCLRTPRSSRGWKRPDASTVGSCFSILAHNNTKTYGREFAHLQVKRSLVVAQRVQTSPCSTTHSRPGGITVQLDAIRGRAFGVTCSL
jgi:hypothetical protein